MNISSAFSKIKSSLQMGNLSYKMVTVPLRMAGFSNESISALESREKAYRYYKRKYAQLIEGYNPENEALIPLVHVPEKTIWICWWQGLNAAPEIVKRCIDSVRRYQTDWNIQIITRKNYNDFVHFPAYVVKKWGGVSQMRLWRIF